MILETGTEKREEVQECASFLVFWEKELQVRWKELLASAKL